MARKIYTSEDIVKRMEALPEVAADFLYSSEMSGIIKGIADKHALHIDQMGLLEAEAGQLILGLTEPQDFAPYITESLKINGEQAAAIAKDVSEQIMSKIRTSMGQPSDTGVPVAALPISKPAPVTPIPAMDTPTSSVVMPSSFKPEVSPISAPAAAPIVAPTPSMAPAPASVAAKSPTTPAPISVITPITPVPAPFAASTPKPAAIVPNLGAADAILSEKKVTPPAVAPGPAALTASATAPATATTPAAAPATAPAGSTPASVASAEPKADPAQPQPYKADPYREPVE